MKFRIEKQVFEKYPDLIVAIPVIEGFDNTKDEDGSLAFLRRQEADLIESFSLDDLTKDERITAYLNAFRKSGVDPDVFLPAHFALSKRVIEGGKLPDINPIVNIYNAMSIKYITPFGGEDLDSVYGDFFLTFAQGQEQWIPIGNVKSKPCVKGELIWRDDYDVSTRSLNWRQCDRTKLTRESRNGYFIMDGF